MIYDGLNLSFISKVLPLQGESLRIALFYVAGVGGALFQSPLKARQLFRLCTQNSDRFKEVVKVAELQ